MSTQPKPAPKISFGPYVYEPGQGSLAKHGRPVRLQGQPLQILSMLVARPGDLVTREEMQRELWRGAALADGEHGLNAAMNKLRQALGDSADDPRYIETLSGRGYRFIAPVQAQPMGFVVEMAAHGARGVVPAWAGYRRALSLAGAIAAIAVTALGAYWLGASRGPALTTPALTFEVLPPEGFELEAASSRQAFELSPDGTTLAFTAMDGTGLQHLFVRDLKSLESVKVAESGGAHTLFWGSDSGNLYFTRRGKLRLLDVESGKHAEVGDSPGFLMHGAPMGGGRIALFTGAGSFWIKDASAMWERKTERYPWAQRLPASDEFLYTQLATAEHHHSVYIAGMDSDRKSPPIVQSDSRAIYVESPGSRGHLVFVRGGTLVAQPFDAGSQRLGGTARPLARSVYSFFPTAAADFSVASNGTLAYGKYLSQSQLAWVDRTGRQISTVSAPGLNLKSGRRSPDGKTVATAIFDVERGAQTIWLIDQPSGNARLLTDEFGLRDSPVWSPDSKRLAYLWAGGGKPPHLRIRGLGAEDKEIELRSERFQSPTDWSPDGRYIVFVDTGFPRVASETQSDVWIADVSAGKVTPLLKSKFHETSPAFSPDGKWLAFMSNESGAGEIYLQRFQGGETPGVAGPRIRVTKGGAQALRWRRDGGEIFYLAFDGRVHAVPAPLTGNSTVGKDTALFGISLTARAAIHSVLGFDVSPDGQRFLIPVTTSPERASIIVKQNWESDLR